MVQNAPPPAVIIVGAGLAGLACARELRKARVPSLVLEAADAVGGRVRTDVLDSFRLDRGFQVLFDAYPEAKRYLNFESLELRPFFNGAEIFKNGRFHRMADPIRHPFSALRALRSPIGSLHDKYYVLLLAQELSKLNHIPRRTDEMPTEELLRAFGFSEEMINRFFRPFFGGIFLERELRTSSRVFQFLFAMMAQGQTVVPRYGMQAIPDQLAAGLPPDSIRLNTPVREVQAGRVTLESGEVLEAPKVVLAVNEPSAAQLLGAPQKAATQRMVTCLYYSTPETNLPKTPILYLDGEGRGPVNQAVVLTNISKDYAPAGQRLISATVLGAPGSMALEGAVREHLALWFGPSVSGWRHLKSYTLLEAQSENRQLRTGAEGAPAKLAPGLYQCGDHLQDISINGALLSGRLAAEAILADG